MTRAEELARCDAEIVEAERMLREGHPDIVGLTLCLADWRGERAILETERGR